MRWVGIVARMGGMRNALRMLGIQKVRDHCENLEEDQRIVSKRITQRVYI